MIMGKPNIKKGDTLYADFIKTLTPEEHEAHLAQRALNREKKKMQLSMKEAMKAVIDSNRDQWLATFNNAAVVLMQKALDSGDVQAFTAVYDRFVGKPDSLVDVTSNGQTMQAPTIIFTPVELDEWKDNQ